MAGGLAGVLVSMTGSGPVGLWISAAGLGASVVLLVLSRRRRLRAGAVAAPQRG